MRAADAASTVSMSGGPSFTSRVSTTYGASTEARVSMWTAVPTADATGTVDISFGANTQTGCGWVLVAYNAISNDALVREDDRSYVPLDKVDDGAIKRAGLRFANATDEHFAKQAFVPKVTA